MAKGAGSYFNGVFPASEPGSATGWKQVNAFPNLTFIDPLWITDLPGSSDKLVMVKGGQIWRFPNNPAVTPAQRSLVLDISGRLQIAPELGLLRMVFHPQFGQAGSPHAKEVFLCYSHRPPGTAASVQQNMWRISRFQWQPATQTIDPNSEEVLIQQYDPDGWHNGGILTFDNNGYLLMSVGDGGAANDSLRLAQKLDLGFFNGVFRIDVDNDPARSHAIRRQPLDPAGKPSDYPASFSQGYGIPNDNPWQDPSGGKLEEYYAIGLRSPHSGHYDSLTGDLWVADVGQSQIEELNQVKAGRNYGWSFFEGSQNGPVPAPAQTYGPTTFPVYSYGTTVGHCIIGGLCYRGTKWATELGGKILIGDNIQATFSAITLRSGQTPLATQLLSIISGTLYSGLSNICTDSAGEVYFLTLNGSGNDGGRILKLDKTGSAAQPPQLLSQTGLFTNMATLEPQADLIPYTVASPLWSDGAEKKRWIVKGNTRLTIAASGNWTFPNGTVLVKHFEIPVDERNPQLTRRLETRVMVRTSEGGKYGVTYKWNAAGTDAQLLSSGAEEDFPVIQADGSTRTQHWSYPSRADCISCHSEQTGQALGIRTHQMNLTMLHPDSGAAVNQLDWLYEKGVVNSVTPAVLGSYLRAASLDEVNMPLEHRVRSYLDANCSHCHRPDSGTPFFDARLETALAGQNLIDAPLTGHFDMLSGARYIKPGDALLSALHVRAASATPGIAMPPLGKHMVDQHAMNLLQEYITSLDPADFAAQPTPQARYFRLIATQGSNAAVAELNILDGRGFPIPVSAIKLAAVSSESTVGNASLAFDGDTTTNWISANGTAPHSITLDLGSVREVGGYIYVPRQSSATGRIQGFDVQLSSNGSDWTSVQTGTFPAGTATVKYDGILKSRKVRAKLAAPAEVRGKFRASIIFDRSVTDLSLADISVQGGTAASLQGQGYFYTVEITPSVLDTSSTIQIDLAANAVNASGLGSQAAGLTVTALDSVPPQFSVGEAAWSPVGLYSVPFDFSEEVTGLEAEDFSFDNGRLISLTGSGAHYVAVLQADRQMDIHVVLAAGAVHDLSGLPNAWSPNNYAFGGAWYRFAPNALYDTLVSKGFTVSYGAYVPDGARSGETSASEDYKMSYSFILPQDGTYIFQAETMALNANSDSFYIGIDGGAPAVWNLNRGSGEPFYNDYQTSVAGETTDYHFNLSAGPHTVEIYAREDGSYFRAPQLLPLRPMPILYNNEVRTSYYPFVAQVHFTRPVTGLTLSDFVVSGAVATTLSGGNNGMDFFVTLIPTAREVFIQLPENRVFDGASGNTASPAWRFLYISPYETWAINAGLGISPADDLRDIDGDGFPQLIEYAFGMDPKNPQASGTVSQALPQVSLSGTGDNRRLRLQYQRMKNTDGTRYIPQFSSDAIHWEDATNPQELLQTIGQWEKIGVTDHAGGSKRFARVKVQAVAP